MSKMSQMNDVSHERLSLKEDSKMTEFGKTLYELNLTPVLITKKSAHLHITAQLAVQFRFSF